MATVETKRINGFDTDGLKQTLRDVSQEPEKGKVKFQVTTHWKGGTRADTRVEQYEHAGLRIPEDFTIGCDEPAELLGTGAYPNPQELLMAAFNSCMLVGYVAGASLKGIELEHLAIETEGELDLRGFLGLDTSVKPGYEEIHYTVRIKGSGTSEQFQEIHETVMATSPNRWNIGQPVRLISDLVVE